jgi:threonine/homoserine efflux transporter RhtA
MTVAAGAINSIGSIFYYRALAREEATGVTILLQFTPVLALFSGIFILGERIGPFQFIAITLLLSAAALIIFSRGKGKSRLTVQLRTAFLLLIAMLFFVGSDTVFILSGEQFNFPTGFFYFLIGRLIVDTTLTLIFKSWRTRIKNVIREFRARAITTAIINEAIDLSANLIWRIAILSVPIALATALENTAQLIATFLLGLVLTIIWPRFGREKLTKRTVSHHLLALAFCILAILLIQLP